MGNGRSGRRQRLRGWWAGIVMVPVLLGCGASLSFKPLPAATLAPGVAPFAVVTLGAEELQSRNGRDGRLLWQQPVPRTGGGTLLAAGGLILYRPQGSEAVDAFAAETGNLVWRLSGCPGYDDALTVTDGLLFVTCGANGPSAPDTIASDTLYALNAATGTVCWPAHGEHFRALAGDLVITQTSSGLAARSLVQGDLRWSHTLAFPPLASPPPPASPALDVAVNAANGLLYLSPDGQYVVALRTRDGSTLWESVPFAYLRTFRQLSRHGSQ